MRIKQENLIPTSSKVNQIKIDNQKTSKNKKNLSSTRTEDKLQLSEQAQDLQRIHLQLKKIPDVRMDKINELRERIDEGKYEVDANRVATSILRDTILDYFLEG